MEKHLENNLDVLHSGMIAIEKLLIKKGITTPDELNQLIAKTYEEYIEDKKNGVEYNKVRLMK